MPPKRRRRFQGLYYHSSPPKVLPMNGQTSNQGRKRRDVDEFAVKLSTIRIWMHEKDIGKLTRILWAGQGSRLCQQASTNPRVKRFLSAVPYVMNSIKDVHQAVIDNNLETLQAKMEPPVPPALITCRDANGLNLIHKAAGLGHTKILEYLIGIWPDGAAETDITGKTALHWAASHKNNMRCYTLLTEAGCDEEAMDYKMKSPTYYRHKPHEIERAFLVYVPEAPRVSPDIATDWEALSEDVGEGCKKLDIKIPDTNGVHGRTNEDSIENTSEVDLNDGISATEEEQPATPLTNGDGSTDSVPQTPVKYDNGTADVGETDEGEAEEAPNNGAVPETEMNGNGNVEAEAEAEAEVGVESGDNGDEAVAKTAEAEVELAEEETNLKTLNETTSTTANGSAESAEEGENETIATTEESKSTAESACTNADEAETEMQENKEVEEAREEGVEAANEIKDSNDEEHGKVVEPEVQQKDDKEKSVENHDEDSANKDSKDEVVKEAALAIDPRIGTEKEEIEVEPDKEIAQSDKENQMHETEKVDKNKELGNIEKDNMKLNEGAGEKESGILDDQEEGIETEVMNRVTRAVDDLKQEADGVEAKVKVEISKAKEEIDKVNRAFVSKDEEMDSEKLESEKENEILQKETESNMESEKLNNEDVNEAENNEEKDEDIKKEVERVKEKESNADKSDSTQDNEKGKLNEKVNETQNIEEKKPEPSRIEVAVVGNTFNDKTNSSNVNLVSNSNEDMNEKSTEKGREIIADKDSALDTTLKRTQLNTPSLEDENISNSNGDKKIANQAATEVNDKTEESENNEAKKHVENTKEDETLNNNTEGEVKPVSGETKDKLHSEQEIEEHANVEKFLKTNKNETTEQTVGKIPRLTTAKPMRGRQNGSAKRNGSAKQKKDALMEGENESEEDNVDEEDESEQNNVTERADEADTEYENKTENEPERKNDDEDESELGYDRELEDDVHVFSDDQETAEKLDENHNEGNYDNGVASSPTSSLAIEGFVTGASEDNRVQSQSAAYVHEKSDVRVAIESGDMEQLALIVLNGDGNKLVNMESDNPDIQAFLNNVPSYMSKIRRVHEAAREGSLLALQQALDRRKFAIAKDETSPNGATPLHVAVVFGNTDIVRYLAARFPETTTTTDNDERTALHYAATINDNGHFYNVLTQLGANSKAVDKLGHTPEFYQNNEAAKDILNYKQLLNNFGAEELEAELLNDQVPDDLHSSRRQLQDVDIKRTLDRCFSVIEESSKSLSGSAASALAHRKPLSATTMQLSVISYLSRFLRRSVFDKIHLRQTRLDHNLFDVIWPAMRKTSKLRHLEEDINCGIVAPDFDVFVVFQEFLVSLIKDMHCMDVNEDFRPHPRIAFFPMENGVRLNTAAFSFDDESNLIQHCSVECSRNLEEFELPLNLTIGQVEQAERVMMGKIFTNKFVEAIGETDSGSYYTLTEILEDNSEVHATLAKLGLLIPLLDTKDPVQAAESLAFNGNLWPYGRGVYINSAQNLALWLNCQEHLRVISTASQANAANMGAAYTLVGRVICFLESELHFKESYFLGYLQARPSYLGTGLKFTTTIKLPNLMKEVDNLRHLCSVRGLNLITNPNAKLDVQLVNMQSLGVFEYVLFQDYTTAVTNIVSLEKDMSLSNSKHIASMLVKIFRRQVENASSQLNPIFKTEQGKYLANNLADPLIKALTEIANKRPEDPVAFLASYLQNYLHQREPTEDSNSGKTNSTAPLTSNSPILRRTGMGMNDARNGTCEDEQIEDDHISNVDEEEETHANLDDRDEHGQSMLHFACARSHRNGALLHLIEESNINITYRDELYRTARDVSLQANQPSNAKDIDRYVLSLAVIGDVKPFETLATEGYDHIVDITDDSNDVTIVDVAVERSHDELANFLRNLRTLEELREELHQMIRDGNVGRVRGIVAEPNGKWVLKAKNYYGRTALHIAVLKENEEMVEHFVSLYPEALKIGDNLERTALHYAMGTNAIESLSRILIHKGAKRTTKDLKGRQPSYYFMNKADILRLQEEEEENR